MLSLFVVAAPHSASDTLRPMPRVQTTEYRVLYPSNARYTSLMYNKLKLCEQSLQQTMQLLLIVNHLLFDHLVPLDLLVVLQHDVV